LSYRFQRRRPSALLAVILLLFSACNFWSRRVTVGEEFRLRPTDKVVVSGTDLTIQLKGVGHQWYVDHRADSPYAELIVNGGQTVRTLGFGDGLMVGEYNIKLKEANPFNDNGGPDCKLVVGRR
jgi:hypothetical protein